MTRLLVLFCAVLLVVPVPDAHAQDEPPGVGLSALLQQGQMDVLVPVWVEARWAVVPGVGVIFAQDVGTDLRLASTVRRYWQTERVHAYAGPRVGLLALFPADDDEEDAFIPKDEAETQYDLLAGVVLGGEYFVGRGFSLGVEAQLTATHSDDQSGRFGNPGRWVVNTGAAVHATVYF